MTKYGSKTDQGRERRTKREGGTWGEVQKLLEDDGIPIPTRPSDDVGPPLLPEDLTAVDDNTLMEYFSKYVRWLEYVGMRLARAEVLAKEMEMELQRARSTAMQRSWTGTKEDRVTMAKAERDLDPKVIKIEGEALTQGAYAKALNTLFDGVERKVSLVSRELTRRTSIEPYVRRENRWSAG